MKMKDFKKFKNIAGIYKIINNINNKIYIGSSSDMYKRLMCHFSELRGNYHKNKKLQNSYNTHGLENFSINILEVIDSVGVDIRSALIKREQYWINLTKCYNDNIGFNLRKSASSTLGSQKTKMWKSVINISDGNVFKNITMASIFYNISRQHISLVCKGKREHVSGNKFAYFIDNEIIIPKYNSKVKKKIMNITNEVCFYSIAQASRFYKVCSSSLCWALKDSKRRVLGCQWGYII